MFTAKYVNHKGKLKPLYWINVLILVLSIFIVGLAYYFDYFDKDVVLLLCVMVLLTSIYLTASYYYTGLYRCNYSDMCIEISWWKWVFKRYPYNRVRGITIKGAERYFGYGWHPAKDKNGRQRAVMTLHDSDFYFLWGVVSNGITLIPENELYELCRTYLDVAELKTVMDKTGLCVHITQNMLELYKSELSEMLALYPERFMIGYRTSDGRNQISPYNQYLARIKQ